MAWLRYVALAVTSTLAFRACIVSLMHQFFVAIPPERLLGLLLPCSVPARQYALRALLFERQFRRWQAQAVIAAHAKELFLSGHAAAAECLARLCLDADWHRRILFACALPLFKSDTARAHELLRRCVDLPTPHEPTPAVHAALDAAALEPVSKEEAISFVERCAAALRVPTASVGRQDEENLDNFHNERQFLFDLCSEVIDAIRADGPQPGLIGEVPRLLQRDHQQLGVVGFTAAILKDAELSQRAFDRARELRAASPYPTVRLTQSRLERNELWAAHALGDADLLATRFETILSELVRTDTSAVRSLMADVAAIGRFDFVQRVASGCRAHFAPLELATIEATALGSAARLAKVDTFLTQASAHLKALIDEHAPQAGAALAGPEQLSLWLELSRAAVALAAGAEMTRAVAVLESAFGRPMLRSLIDVCASAAEALSFRALPATSKIELKIFVCLQAQQLSAQLSRPGGLPLPLLLEAAKLVQILLDISCEGAARELYDEHVAHFMAVRLDEEPLAAQLFVDVLTAALRLHDFARAAELAAQLLLAQLELSALRNALAKEGHFVAAVKAVHASRVVGRATFLQQLARDWAQALRFKRSRPNSFAQFQSIINSLPGLSFSDRFAAFGGFVSGVLTDTQVDLYEDVGHFYSSTGEPEPPIEPVNDTVFLYSAAEIQADLEKQ